MDDANARRPVPHVWRAICARPWAITPEALQTILEIAARESLTVDAVEAQLGRPLDNTHDVTVRNGVATIPVSGPLTRYAGLFSQVSGATSIETLAQDLNTALADPAIRSIILYCDSPGGEVNGTSELADMVYASRGTKPIVAYVADQACSAAYWIASAADRVVIADTAIVGSIGAVIGVPDPSAKSARSIEFVSSQAPHKRPDPTTEAGRGDFQTLVDDLGAVFVSAVARNRGVGEDTVLSDFGRGGVFVGRKAVEAGLADTVGTYEALLSELAAPVRKTPSIHRHQSAVSSGSTTVRLAVSAPTEAPKTTRRSTPMSKLTEWLFGAASADGVEIDEADAARIEAALEGANPAQAEAITAMQKQLAARDSEIAELLQAKRDQEAVLATAAAEQRHTAAMSLADRLVAEKRLMPAASETFAALAEHCASLEAGLAVTASASDLLTAFAASLPDLSVFTTEHVDTEAAAALPTQEVTAIPGAPQKPSAERKAQLLKHTPLGRQALSTK